MVAHVSSVLTCEGASGAASRVAASLAEDRRSWRVPLPWFESGKHQVSLYVDGAQVMHHATLSMFLHLEFWWQGEQPGAAALVSPAPVPWLYVNFGSLDKVIK